MFDSNEEFSEPDRVMNAPMSEINKGHGLIVLNQPHQIAAFQKLSLYNGLKLEIKGMRMTAKGRSCYAMIKERFALKGTKEKVLREFGELLEAQGIRQPVQKPTTPSKEATQ